MPSKLNSTQSSCRTCKQLVTKLIQGSNIQKEATVKNPPNVGKALTTKDKANIFSNLTNQHKSLDANLYNFVYWYIKNFKYYIAIE